MDDHGIGICNIKSRFNNGCGYQHINLPVDEIRHDPLQLMLPHLTVSKSNHRLRHHSLDLPCYLVNIRHPVVYIIHLSASRQFPVNSLPDHFFIVFHHIGLDGRAVYRRLFQHAHVADPGQTHMQRPGDRSCGQRHNVHIFLHLLDLFLVGHSKTLLLIDDKQSQILKLQIL